MPFYFLLKLIPVVYAKANNKPDLNNIVDVFIGTEQCRPLFRLFWEALLTYQDKDYKDSLETILQNIISNDDISAKLFADINKHCPAASNSITYKIRLALLILDNEISHQLIFILTGLDVRGILLCANYIAKGLSKIIFNYDVENDIEEGYIGWFLNNEMLCIKSSFERLGYKD